jgi:hypothetical protein
MANDDKKKAELTDEQQAALNAGQTVTVSPTDPNSWPDQDPSKRPGYAEYPRMAYHQSGQTKVIASEDEWNALGEGWGESAIPEADEARHDAVIRAQKQAVARKMGAEAAPTAVPQVEVINQPTTEERTQAREQEAERVEADHQARKAAEEKK